MTKVPRTERVCNAPSLSRCRHSCVERPSRNGGKDLNFGRETPQTHGGRDDEVEKTDAAGPVRSPVAAAGCGEGWQVACNLASYVQVGCAADQAPRELAMTIRTS